MSRKKYDHLFHGKRGVFLYSLFLFFLLLFCINMIASGDARAHETDDAPVIHVPGPQLTPMNVPLMFGIDEKNPITITYSGREDAILKTGLFLDNGSLTVSGNSGAIVNGNGTSNILITGTLNQINKELDGLRYDPPLNWHGVLPLEIEVYDTENTGPSGPIISKASVKITVGVTISPQPPFADAGSGQTVFEFNPVSLDGTGSHGVSGEIISYKWVQISGTPADIENAGTPNPWFTAPETGPQGEKLVFMLTVEDENLLTSADTVEITIKDSDTDAGSFEEGTTIVLKAGENNGSGNISYEWSQIYGPLAPLSDPSAENPSFVGPVVEKTGAHLAFRLETVNNQGDKLTEQVSLRIFDNGITGFPDDAFTFKPVPGRTMGIKITGGKLVSLINIDPASIGELKNRPESLIYGLIGMKIRLKEAGKEAKAIIFLENPAPYDFRWFKYGKNSGWYECGAVFDKERKSVTLTFIDGGMGDDDGSLNGMIDDPSGLGKRSSSTESPGSGDSGSCFWDSLFFID